MRAQTLGIAGDVALAGAGDSLVALDLGTGKERWRARAGPEPVVSGVTAVVVDGQRVRVLDASTGKERWSVDLPAGLAYVHSLKGEHLYLLGAAALESHAPMAPVVFGPLVGTAASAARENFVALSRDTGALAWRGRTGSVAVQPVVKDGVLYVAGQGPHRLYAFKADTGAVLWTARLGNWPMGVALTEGGALLVSADNLALYAYRTD